MKKSQYKYSEKEEIIIHIKGKLKDELVKRSVKAGHNFSPEIFLLSLLAKMWRIPYKECFKKEKTNEKI